jgi:lysine 2,3-aminomutase
MNNFIIDPLTERKHTVTESLIHKYPNRVLCLLTKDCNAGCPFCFRKNIYQRGEKNKINLEKIIEYLEKNKNVNEFIFSGGEPLLEGQLLEKFCDALFELKQIKIIRIHSKLPISAPQIMPWENLEKITEKSKLPLYFLIHVNSCQELEKAETLETISRLRKMGFILLSQTVFLKDVNDNQEELENLFNKLLENGVKPYYIFHCDRIENYQKFQVDLKKEIYLMSAIRKTVSGLAYPLHVIDSESGDGKIPVPTNHWKTDFSKYKDFSQKENLV